MTNAVSIVRSLLIYGLCLPFAVYLGYIIAQPMDRPSFVVVAIALMLPLVPVLLKWHHFILIVSWNMSMVLFFFPGSPSLCIIMSLVSFTLSIVQHILVRQMKFLSVPSVILPLIFLTFVIVITANLTGGIGIRVLGGESYGGKRYVVLLGAIIGYFALTSHRVPPGKEFLYVAVYYLGALTALMGSFAPWFPSSLHFIFTLFPVENLRALAEGNTPGGGLYLRLGGLTFGTLAVAYYILARHGLNGTINLTERWRFLPFQFRNGFVVNQPWRFMIFLGVFVVSLMGGYRSIPLTMGLLLLIQFYLEGLFRSRLVPVLIVVGVMTAVLIIPFSNKLPYSIQRSLSFLPLNIDPIVRMDAETSAEWRLNIWRNVIPTIPKYLVVGKGYSIDPRELEMSNDLAVFNNSGFEAGATVASDFHNGPLSVIIPLGIFGAIGFLWFLAASIRCLLFNYRYGEPRLRLINTFLLASFTAKMIFFFVVFGAFYSELAIFTGMIGLSICINGGMRRPLPVTASKPAPVPPFRFPKPARPIA